MGNPYHPLRAASTFLYEASKVFEDIATKISGVPIIGEYLSLPFYWVSYWFNEVAYWLNEADIWVSSLQIGTFIESLTEWVMDQVERNWYIREFFRGHFVAWIMYRLGFSIGDCFYFETWPELFIRWKITGLFPFLSLLLEDPFGWIKEKIVERIPVLGYLFEDPAGWVLYMLGVPWWERIFWSDHLFAWLLYRWGLRMDEALMFEANPIYWVEWQVLKRWPFLDDLILDPVGWLWREFMEAVDRYLDINLDWLVRTGERILNSVWQMRL